MKQNSRFKFWSLREKTALDPSQRQHIPMSWVDFLTLGQLAAREEREMIRSHPLSCCQKTEHSQSASCERFM
jgi:hypothetical protein